jgi:glycosyltransferase involved in cell wall biosynthesis
MKIYIIVPVYNEGKRAITSVVGILKYSKNSVVVVDDGSTDDSFLRLQRKFGKNERVILLRHEINLGKGAAMKTGVENAWSIGGEAVIFLDADGQHNPKHLARFEKYLMDYPIVFGYRSMDKGMPFVRKMGNIFAINLVRILFNIKKRDLLSGYLGFQMNVYKQLEWTSPRYGIETEMATKIGKNKLAFKEIRIDTIYIDKHKGVTMLDAVKILFQIPFWYFSK